MDSQMSLDIPGAGGHTSDDSIDGVEHVLSCE